ncbi:hypothetical protein G6F40_017944 [Rhizopus arrhizus]|nr:hypothetical protein G6F40_017944 [Rhizopus arrhizus]
MHAQFDAVGTALGDAQQLDAVAQAFGVLDVFSGQLRNAFDVGAVELHRHAEGQRGQQGAGPRPARRRTAGRANAFPTG